MFKDTVFICYSFKQMCKFDKTIIIIYNVQCIKNTNGVRKMNYKLESLISIFTVDKSEIKVLLVRNKKEPYKGYWILPGSVLKENESLEDSITDAIYDQTGLLNVYVEQVKTFSKLNRHIDERMIATSFIGLVDSVSVTIKKEERKTEMEWFSISNLPKTAYDHEEIIKFAINCLSKKITNSNILKCLFPSDFSLPELQKIYEQILNRDLDRRNFRKKFINLNLIEDTGYRTEGSNGRPAKLYRFKEDVKEIDLF